MEQWQINLFPIVSVAKPAPYVMPYFPLDQVSLFENGILLSGQQNFTIAQVCALEKSSDWPKHYYNVMSMLSNSLKIVLVFLLSPSFSSFYFLLPYFARFSESGKEGLAIAMDCHGN